MTTPVSDVQAERIARPVLLTVDDDPSVSRAVARDLRRRYGEDYRIMRADSGEEALQARRLYWRHRSVGACDSPRLIERSPVQLRRESREGSRTMSHALADGDFGLLVNVCGDGRCH